MMPAFEEWFGMPSDGRYEVAVRPWQAGDGLTCSCANHGGRVRCGKPVVVERRRKLEEPACRGRWDRTGTRRVLCLNHLTKLVTGDGPSKSADDAERRASEKVVMRHWDEYETELKQIRDDAREAVFSELPDDLRSAVMGKLRAADEL